MNSVTVQIVIEGLIALVPIHETLPGAPDAQLGNTMAALVVDATTFPEELEDIIRGPDDLISSRGERTDLKEEVTKQMLELVKGERFCFQQHESMIHFPTTSRECLRDRGDLSCKFDNQECICTLNRHEVSIGTDAKPPMRRLGSAKPRSLPFDNTPESAGNFAYAANLSLLGYQLDRRFVFDPIPPQGLQGRFIFPFDSVLACALGSRIDERSDNVHELEFRRRGTEGKSGDLSQAVAQSMIATLSLPEEDSRVLLLVRTFGEEEWREVFELEKGSIRILLKNHREPVPSGHPCDDGVGRDFGFFYRLVESPPAWIDQEIPHVKLTSWKNGRDIEPRGCRDTKLPISRPICPIGSFNPISE